MYPGGFILRAALETAKAGTDAAATEAAQAALDAAKAVKPTFEKSMNEALAAAGYSVAAEEDITDAVAPSIDLEQRLFNVLGHGVTRVSDEIRGKRKLAHWALGRMIGLFLSQNRQENLMQRLTGTTRTSEAFRTYNRYQIFKLFRV